MTWDYRVMVRGGRYAAYEVYYEDGRITTCGADPTYSTGESPEDRPRNSSGIVGPWPSPFSTIEHWKPKVSQPRVADA